MDKYFAILLSPLAISFILGIFYYWRASKLDYSFEIDLSGDFNRQQEKLIKISFEKVNGWNRMVMSYTLLHYFLNIGGIDTDL